MEANTGIGDDVQWRFIVPVVNNTAPVLAAIPPQSVDEETLVFTDVVVGDVWLCSGQPGPDEKLLPAMIADWRRVWGNELETRSNTPALSSKA